MRRWFGRPMSRAGTTIDTACVQATHPPEVQTEMPQEYIVIFLLFFTVLAFAWFYLQRAKTRSDAPTQATETAPAAPAAPAEHADHDEHADHSH